MLSKKIFFLCGKGDNSNLNIGIACGGHVCKWIGTK
jgi:hypothetical protein